MWPNDHDYSRSIDKIILHVPVSIKEIGAVEGI
jgi:hypothetical protein